MTSILDAVRLELNSSSNIDIYAIETNYSHLAFAFSKTDCKLASWTEMEIYAFPALMDTDGIMMQEVAYVDD